MNIITALKNPNINKKIKEKTNFNIIGNDIQYQEGIIEMLEKNGEIDLIIISELLPGEYSFRDLINKIKPKSNVFTVDFNNQLSNTYCYDNYIYIDKNKVYNTLDKRKLIGNHNLINIMFGLSVSNILNLDNNKSIEMVNNFTPLEHRLELVGTINDITYYNDAIATIPEATINAIESLKIVNTLIFGGLDRGIDYNDFIEYLNKSTLENLICMPTTGHKIANELIKLNCNKNIYLVNTLEEAVKKAKSATKKETICLMSPAAASYEYFKNFEEKGCEYKRLVKSL